MCILCIYVALAANDLKVILQFCVAVWLVEMKHNVIFICINSFRIIIFIDYVIIIDATQLENIVMTIPFNMQSRHIIM